MVLKVGPRRISQSSDEGKNRYDIGGDKFSVMKAIYSFSNFEGKHNWYLENRPGVEVPITSLLIEHLDTTPAIAFITSFDSS